MTTHEENVRDLDSPEASVRRAAILAMGVAQDPRDVPALLDASRNDESLELRLLARRALQEPDPTVSRPPTGPLALDAPDPAQRLLALRRIIASQDGLFLPALEVRAGIEQDPIVRAHLVFALGVLGAREQLQLISKFFEDTHPEVRVAAVRAMELIGNGKAYIMLVRALQDPDAQVRADVVRALERLGKANILRCCNAMFASAEPWMRRSATYCVAVARFPEALLILAAAAADPDPELQAQGVAGLRALAETGFAPANQALEQVRARIAAGQVAPAPERRLETIDLSASEANEDVNSNATRERRIAMRKSVKLDAGEAQLVRLAADLVSPVVFVRAAAVDALLSNGTELNALRPLLDDPDPGVRARVIRGLRDQPGVDAKRLLDEMCANADPEFRRCAVYVLSELPEAVSRSGLESLKNDGDSHVAELARHALARFVPPAVTAPVVPAAAAAPASQAKLKPSSASGLPRQRSSGASAANTKVAVPSPPREGRKLIVGVCVAVALVILTVVVLTQR